LSPLPSPEPVGRSPQRARVVAARPRARGWITRLLWALLLTFLAVSSAPLQAHAEDEPGARPAARERRGAGDEQVFDFTGLEIGGRLRTPQLLYFLDRAREELRQAALERRSFLPEMVRSIDEESL
jgi:hypothetical protein